MRCVDCGGPTSEGRYRRCRKCNNVRPHVEPLYCTCDQPAVDAIDQCHLCFRANREAVYSRYGWPLP